MLDAASSKLSSPAVTPRACARLFEAAAFDPCCEEWIKAKQASKLSSPAATPKSCALPQPEPAAEPDMRNASSKDLNDKYLQGFFSDVTEKSSSKAFNDECKVPPAAETKKQPTLDDQVMDSVKLVTEDSEKAQPHIEAECSKDAAYQGTQSSSVIPSQSSSSNTKIQQLRISTPEDCCDNDAASHKRPSTAGGDVSPSRSFRSRLKATLQGIHVSTERCKIKSGPPPCSGVFRLIRKDQSIENFFEIGEQIYCSDGRSQVLHAVRKVDGLECVIKIRPKRKSTEAEQCWRMVMAQLTSSKAKSCPHVLDILEVLEDESSFYCVMPHCTGGELLDFLLNETDVREIECKRIVREILQALRNLHVRGLVHRDIKPENIMFSKDPRNLASPDKTVKIIDFDTCIEWTPKTAKLDRIVGTVGYIAPETLMGTSSPQSDLWAVGVILYILMAGDMPYPNLPNLKDMRTGSSSAMQMAKMIETVEIDWTADPWPEFPETLDLCQKLLAFDPMERIGSAQEALQHPWLSTGPGGVKSDAAEGE